jgi:hypothetical protein
MGQLTKSERLKREKNFLKSLIPSKRQRIQKLYPYRQIRNKLLRDLWNQGVPQVLLAKVSKLSESHLFRILHQKKEARYDHKK